MERQRSRLTAHIASPSTIRAVRASIVRSNFGHHLLSSEGSHATFQLSEQTTHIDEFLSHSWSSSGHLKWLSLCLHQNGQLAVGASIAVGSLAMLLETWGAVALLPVAAHQWFDGHTRFITFFPYIASYTSFLTFLIFGSALTPAPLRRDPLMFLDKICIHQTDPERKRRGLAGINQYLRRSSKLLVCYASDAPGRGYFERLWCVFELAAFVSKRDDDDDAHVASSRAFGRSRSNEALGQRLLVLPLWRPVCLLMLQAGLVAAHASEYVSAAARGGDVAATVGAAAAGSTGVYGMLHFSINYFVQVTACMLGPFWLDIMSEEEKERLLEQARAFRFERVKCQEPGDRVQVRLAIDELYSADPSPSGTRSDTRGDTRSGSMSGVERFERDVQGGAVYSAMATALGQQRGLLTRGHVLMAFLPNLWRAFAYFPRNLSAQPNLFLFHGFTLMCLAPLCRAAALLFHTRFLAGRRSAPRRLLGCVLASALFALLVLMSSSPALVLLRLL